MLLIFGSKNTGPILWISTVDGIASSLGAHLKTSTAGHVKHDDVNLQGAQAHGLAVNSCHSEVLMELSCMSVRQDTLTVMLHIMLADVAPFISVGCCRDP